MFESLGSLTYRFRYVVVAAWVIAAVVAARFAPSIASQGTADQAAFLPPTAPSAVAQSSLERSFPGSTSTSSVTITFSRDTGLTDADRAYLDAFGAWTRSADAPQDVRAAVTSVDTARTRPELASMLQSADGQLELLNANLDISSAGDQATAVVAALRAHAAGAPAGLAVHVTGTAGITNDYLQAIKSGTDSTTRVTIILVLVILLLIYRAPLAALVPLATIGGAFLVSRGLLGVLAAAGWQISSLLDTFVVVLVFGVGTDYTIFLISRYREEVGQGRWHDASRRTVRRIGAVISASAATVMVGLGAMAFGDFGMIRSTGPALAVAIFVTLVAGLTLAPALLGVFGHYVFWPRHEQTGAEAEPEGLFAHLAAVVTRHPGLVAAALVIGLAVPAFYLPQMKTNFDTLAELPTTSDARQGYDIVAAHLGKGRLVQSTALIDTGAQGDILSPASLARLRDTVATVSATSGVASVTSLVTPKGDGAVPDGFKPSATLASMADSFASGSGGASGSASSSASVLDPKVSSGLSDALDYLDALGLAFPDVAGRAQFRAATAAITSAQSIVAQARAQSVVATQLRNLASAVVSPATIAASAGSGTGTGAGADTALLANYLAELAAAYPEVRGLPAFADATAAAASLQRQPGAAAAVAAADALDTLAIHFDAQPGASLAATSLAGTPAALEAKRQATAAFAALPDALRGLAGVFTGRPDDLFIPVGLGGSDAASLEQAVEAFVSADHTATRFYVTSTADPYSTTSFAMVRSVQAELEAAAPGFGIGGTASLGGPTAQFADVQTVLASDFQRVGLVTVLGILIVLALLLRALVAPLYLVATVLLSYASAVGFSAWLFQGPLGQPGVSFYLPLLVFVLLVALGSDYNIFLMSRVREESESRPIRAGVRVASGRTGAVITSAGLILAGTFGSMASAPLAVLVQIGAAVAIGVLIDTFLVRSVLVPAITAVVGDRAWWPSGLLFGAGPLAPAAGGGSSVGPAAEPSAGRAAVQAVAAPIGPTRRARVRTIVAVALAALVPVTFAGLLVWASPGIGTPAVAAAVVNGDDGTTMTAADGSTRTLQLGASLVASLVRGGSSGLVSWTVTDATAAADGLSAGTYVSVLTIPAGYSRAVVAFQADRTGLQPAPTLHLETSDSSGAMTRTVAGDVSAAVSQAATRGATTSAVGDILLAVSTTHDALSGAAATAHDLAARTTTLASDASGIDTVTGELVAGLDTLATGTAGAVDGAAKLSSGTAALATGATQLSRGAASLATGAKGAATGAAQLSSGAAALSSGAAALRDQTAGLPAQSEALDQGAAAVATGAAASAAGAASLSSGLQTLKQQTAGLGTQVGSLDSGAVTLATGADSLATGASQAASGASTLATNASQLATAVGTYANSVAALAAACASMGGSDAVCAALSAIAASNASLTAAATGVSGGASQLAAATRDVSTGAGDVLAGANGVHAGTSQLAAAVPPLESAITQSAAGAASLASGTAAVASGATTLAGGTHQLAAGMPALADGTAALATAAGGVASGASSLSAGVAGVASGAAGVAVGAQQTASGAASLAAGTAASASGARTLAAAIGQAADGARVVQAETGQLGRDGSTLATDATSAATSLASATAGTPVYPSGAQQRLAASVAAPVSVEANTAHGATSSGLAPYAAALALWLGALAAFVVLPRARRRLGRAGWAAVLTNFAAALLLSLVAASLLVAGLLLAGLSVVRPLELLLLAAVAAAAFVAIVQALVAAAGRIGWLAGLLLAGLQLAASGLFLPLAALPGPLAALHPLLPLSWASDALAAAIGGGSADVGLALAVLAAWLIGALAVTLAIALRHGGGPRPAARYHRGGSHRVPQAIGP